LSKANNTNEELNKAERIDVDDDWFEVIKMNNFLMKYSNHLLKILITFGK